MALPNVVFVAGDEAPEVLPSEREADDPPSALMTDFANVNQRPSFLLPAIWYQVRYRVRLLKFSGGFLTCGKDYGWFVCENQFTPQ